MEPLLVAVLFAAMNLTPIPLPPAWLVVVLLGLKLQINPALLVAAAAAGTALGRVGLATWTRALGPQLLGRGTRANLDALAVRLQGRRGTTGAAALLAVSPPPSGALYMAAGLLRVPLAIVGTACLAGRLVTYGTALAVATAGAGALEARLRGWAAPGPIIIGLAATAVAIWLLLRLDWIASLEHRRLRLRIKGAGAASRERDAAPPG